MLILPPENRPSSESSSTRRNCPRTRQSVSVKFFVTLKRRFVAVAGHKHSAVNYAAEHHKPLFWRRLATKLSPLVVRQFCPTGWLTAKSRIVRPVQLGSEGVSPFHGEAGLANLRWVCWRDAGKLSADVVDDVEIAVGTIVVAEA